MADAINLDPEVTKLALQYAQQSLTPAFRDSLNNIKQEAANSGALQSSTFTDALTKASSDLNSQFQAITTQAALSDRERALSNRMDLFGTGLNTLQSAGQMGLSAQSAENQFNLSNYENQLAQWQLSQKAKSGGLMGGLMGAGGGALAGIALAPFTGGLSLGLTAALAAGGGALGALGTENTGSQLLSTGAGLLGGGLGNIAQTPTGQQPYIPRSSATSNSLSGSLGPQGNYIKYLMAGGLS